MEPDNPNPLRCPVCGGVEFIQGAPRDIAPDTFIPMKRTTMQEFLGTGGELLQPMKCQGCGLVLNFGKPEP